jgi:dephospho-CoA kinase
MSSSERLEDILFSHYNKYPRMQIQDMVKLIYQNEFAGGHMVNNRAESLKRLRDELAEIRNVAAGTEDRIGTVSGSELFEDIGNGYCRLCLHGLPDYSISPETANSFFVYSANTNKGSMAGFEDKLAILRSMCGDGRLPYAVSDLDVYLSEYRKKDCPPVSHSGVYREAYSPAYRVVSSVFMDYFEVFCRIDALIDKLKKQHECNSSDAVRSVNVAIEGNCGAGKTSLASLLEEIYDCNVFHMDHFFLTPELRTEERLKEAGGNVDYVRFKNEVINGLDSGKEFSYRIYDCSTCSMDQTVDVKPKMLNIIEGSYCMHPTLAESYDLKIFLRIGQEEQSRRILERNGPFMHERFISQWIPLENRYFSEFDIVSKCDIVIDV